MITGSLRDAKNFWFRLDGTPEESFSAATTPGEVAEWLEATNLYATIRDEGNFFLNKGLSHALGLKPSPSRDIVLLINAHILKQLDVTQGKKKSSGFIRSAFPNHFVVLMDEITETSDDGVYIKVWTWENVYQGRVDRATFKASYYGAVMAVGARG